MSTVDARDITKPVDEDFVPQATAELRALKVLVAAIETALQNEDLDIRADVATLLRSKLQVPILDLALPALVANGALVVNGAGTGLVWDADYGAFVANAAALTAAVEDATNAAAAAQLAADAAQEAVDTGAVNKASTDEQIMNGDLTIQQDSARLRLQSDTTPTKRFDILLSSTKAQLYVEGGLSLEVSGELIVTDTVNANYFRALGGVTLVSGVGAELNAESGTSIIVQPGADLTIADAPVVATDAANKRYVDQCYSSKFFGNGVSTTYGGDGATFRHVEFTVGPFSDCTIGTGIISTRPTVLSPNTGVTGVARIRILIKMTHVSGTQATAVKFRIHDGFTNNNPEFIFALTAGSMTNYEWVDVSTQLQGVGATLRFGLSGADGSTNVSFLMLAAYTELYHQPT